MEKLYEEKILCTATITMVNPFAMGKGNTTSCAKEAEVGVYNKMNRDSMVLCSHCASVFAELNKGELNKYWFFEVGQMFHPAGLEAFESEKVKKKNKDGK